MGLKLGPKDVLSGVVALLLGAFALGAAAVLVVVGLGKLGVRLIPTVPMDLLILTTAWWSLVLSLIIAGGFGAAAVLLIMKRKPALIAWGIGFAAAVAQQGLESGAAASSGAVVDPSGWGVVAILAVAGWAIYTALIRQPRKPPPGPMPR